MRCPIVLIEERDYIGHEKAQKGLFQQKGLWVLVMEAVGVPEGKWEDSRPGNRNCFCGVVQEMPLGGNARQQGIWTPLLLPGLAETGRGLLTDVSSDLVPTLRAQVTFLLLLHRADEIFRPRGCYEHRETFSM